MEAIHKLVRRFRTVSLYDWLCILVVFWAAILRFYHWYELPLTNDETSALMRLDAHSFKDLLYRVVWDDGHPALVQWILWVYSKCFSLSIPLIKLPFLLSGLGSVVLLILIGKKTNRLWAGLLSAAMLATLQFPVMYSQIARPYATGLFLCLWAFYLWFLWLVRCRKSDPIPKQISEKRTGWLQGIVKYLTPTLFGISIFLGASNHYFNLLFLCLIFIFGFVFLKPTKWLLYIFPWALAAIFYIPEYKIFFHHFQVGSPGWLHSPTPKIWIKHLAFEWGFSIFPLLLWALFTLASIVWGRLKLIFKSPNSRGEDFDGEGSQKVLSTELVKIPSLLFWILYGLPMLVGYLYSVYRAPIFQDSIFLFSFPFALLGISIWVVAALPTVRWKAGLVLATLFVNTWVLIHERKHYDLFNHQTYNEAIVVLKKWQVKVQSDSLGSAVWVYGFEPYFFGLHEVANGYCVSGDLASIEHRSKHMQRTYNDKFGCASNSGKMGNESVRFFRADDLKYAEFRNLLKSIKAKQDVYFINMIGADPMLRIWIQGAFPNLIREMKGVGFDIMHFSKTKRASSVKLLSKQLSNGHLGKVDQQYGEVLEQDLGALKLHRFGAEYIAKARLKINVKLLTPKLEKKIRLVSHLLDAEGNSVRFLDKSLADMDYSFADFGQLWNQGYHGDVSDLSKSTVEVNLYVVGRLVDVDWGAWLNHGVFNFGGNWRGGYKVQTFIDNKSELPYELLELKLEFVQGNNDVYGLVNPIIP